MTIFENQTVQSICNTYTGVLLTPHPQQLSNLLKFCLKLLDLYNSEKKYEKDKKKLNELFFNPISYLKEKYSRQFKLPANPVDWDISNLEWVLYRSQRYPTKLGEEFTVDTRKATKNKKILLSQALTIAHLYKQEVDSVFNKILIEEKIQYSFNFDAFNVNKEIQQTKTNI